MRFQYNDGGRLAAGFKGPASDCVCRAITIATGKSYTEVYSIINELSRVERKSKKHKGKSSARTGTYKATTRRIMEHFGFVWEPCMEIGSGCKVHLRDGEIPIGKVVCSVSKHLVAVIDGIIYDTHDPSRGGTRCVYGFWCLPHS